MKLSPPPNMYFPFAYIYISLFDEILHYLQFILLSHLVVRSEHVLGRILHVHKISKRKKNAEQSTAISVTIDTSPVLEFTLQSLQNVVVAQPICLTSEFILTHSLT